MANCPIVQCEVLYNTCHQTLYTLLDVQQAVRGCGIAVEEAFRDEICSVLMDNIPVIKNCSTVEDNNLVQAAGTVEGNNLVQPVQQPVEQPVVKAFSTSPPSPRQTILAGVYTTEEDNNSEHGNPGNPGNPGNHGNNAELRNDVIEYSIVDSSSLNVRRNSSGSKISSALTSFCHRYQSFLLYAGLFIIGDL